MRGRCREGGRGEENKKRGRELLEKRRGTSASLYLGEGPSWQMKSGGEGGHGAAKPHGVIHRYPPFATERSTALAHSFFLARLTFDFHPTIKGAITRLPDN